MDLREQYARLLCTYREICSQIADLERRRDDLEYSLHVLAKRICSCESRRAMASNAHDDEG